MTTYKTCQQCQQIVEWAPDPVIRGANYAIYPWCCRGGNAPRHCKLPHNKAAEREVDHFGDANKMVRPEMSA